MYGVSLMIMIFTTLANSLTGSGSSTNAVGIIIMWRVLLGIGIGGDYPMSAIITSEFASTRYRGRMMAAVFSMQGVYQTMPSESDVYSSESSLPR
jgi:MFS transporter, PHS family, inorganic phosphate transporter